MDRILKNRCLGIMVLILAIWGAISAEEKEEEKNPYLWEPRTTSVAVFKNDLGFFLREGEVGLRDGWCTGRQVPPAAFGTLSIFSHKEGEIVDIVGSGPGELVEFDGKDAPKDAEAKKARLNGALNLQVCLSYKFREKDASAAGKLVSLGAEFAILENDSNTIAVPVKAIFKMQVLNLPVRAHVTGADKKQPERTKLGMAYLRKGITWIPEYTLKILDQDNAELSLRGTLVNEAEDLIHCDVHFVVGVPHFIHTDYNAPLSVGQMIRTIGMAVAPQALQSQMMNNAFDLNVPPGAGGAVVERPADRSEGDLKKALGNLPQIEGAAGTDYTVYTKKDLTVRMGEKAVVTLFTHKIKYSHIYKWNLPEKMKHFIVLENATDTAWTTGACLAISAGQPLCEDILKYTPKSGKCDLPVTTAINIAHSATESETERQLKIHSPARDVFLDLVTLKGELSLSNYEKTRVEIEISTTIPGKPLSASDNGALTIDTANLKILERQGTIRWMISLDPGGKKTLGYQYERYVPSY